MKIPPTILLSLLLCAQGAHASGVTWGSLTYSNFRDSNGNRLDESFQIQLGFFEDPLDNAFMPGAGNVDQWVNNWRVFDQALLNLNQLDPESPADYFTSEAFVNSDGTSTGLNATNTSNNLNVNFEGKAAYIWLYNNKNPSTSTEWFLGRASDWILPNRPIGCCDTTPNLQWSVSDLVNYDDPTQSVTPVWGSQSGKIGSGEYTDPTPGAYDLQTFTFVPEPSSFLMALLGSSLLLRRTRREHVMTSDAEKA